MKSNTGCLVDYKLAVNREFSLPADQLQAYTIILKKKKTYQFCNRFRKGEIWRWIETLKDI